LEHISQITPASDVVEDIKKQIEDENKNKQEDQESKELNEIMDKHSKALENTFKEIMGGDMDE
jgi:molecular chaperone DnaK (HSP70)